MKDFLMFATSEHSSLTTSSSSCSYVSTTFADYQSTPVAFLSVRMSPYATTTASFSGSSLERTIHDVPASETHCTPGICAGSNHDLLALIAVELSHLRCTVCWPGSFLPLTGGTQSRKVQDMPKICYFRFQSPSKRKLYSYQALLTQRLHDGTVTSSSISSWGSALPKSESQFYPASGCPYSAMHRYILATYPAPQQHTIAFQVLQRVLVCARQLFQPCTFVTFILALHALVKTWIQWISFLLLVQDILHRKSRCYQVTNCLHRPQRKRWGPLQYIQHLCRVLRRYTNPSSILYPRWNNSALFPAEYVF